MTKSASKPRPITLTVPIETLLPQDQGADEASQPSTGAAVNLLIGGTVQSLDGGQATVSLESVNGEPLDPAPDDNETAGDPSESDIRRMAQEADGEDESD